MNTPPPSAGPLVDAARWLGVVPSYVDHAGTPRHASAESLLAVAAAVAGCPGASERELIDVVDAERAAAAQRVVPPVVVVWQPSPAVVRLQCRDGRPWRVEVTIDDADPQRGGERLGVDVVGSDGVDLGPLDLPAGRHRLRVLGPGVPSTGSEATLVCAPRRVAGIADVVGGGPAGAADPNGTRPWGVFAPVWSAWSVERPEVHLGSLDSVGVWAAQAGASLVGTLPLLATFADHPCDPSPYSPVSRRRWNEALIDLRAAPGFAASPAAQALADAVAPVDPADHWDPVGHWAAVRPVLDALAEQARADDAVAAPVLAAIAADPELAAYAWFRAEVERTGSSWPSWPSRVASAGNPVDAAGVRADPLAWRWAWSQWVVAGQIDTLSQRFASRRQALYLDLALGAHADGFDTWVQPALFGWGASVGAPPDAMFGGGQDWGFPPQRPAEARASGHDEWSRALRAHFAVCGVLRLDHILGLQRLFWVPRGAAPTDGVYVRQPLDELFAVLAVEAQRAGAAVVGEDLGTVDPEVRDAMANHGVAGMSIAQFAVDAPTGQPRWPHAGQLAAVNTHDMPTFAGWLTATDADHRRRAGLIDDAGVADVRRQRAAEVAALRAALGVSPSPAGAAPPAGWRDLLAALLARLGATDADAVLVALDDLVGATEQQNVPGTPWSRPNWVVRLPVALEALAADPWVIAAVGGLDAARRSTERGGEG